MGKEVFFESYPPEYMGVLKANLESLRTKDRGSSSVVVMFAEKLISWGSGSLREISERYSRGTTAGLNAETMNKIINEGKDEIGAILLGSTVVTIEDAIRNGVLDVAVFKSRVGLAYSGAGIPLWEEFYREGPTGVPADDVLAIIKIAEKDRTFSGFFDQRTMPESLKGALPANWEVFVSPLISGWRERSMLLILGH